MEQARYWMWTKTKQAAPINNPSSYDESSWEEQAFAEDTAGGLGGCWPPRSYSCTFCRREFRSAQALGGHMNVHRRDRARLKQSPTSNHTETNVILQGNNHFQSYPFSATPNSSPGLIHYPNSHICSLVYSTSPNPSSDHPVSLPSPASPPRVSTNVTAEENSSKKTIIIKEELMNKGTSSPGSLRGTWPLDLGEEEKMKKEKNPSRDVPGDEEPGCRAEVDNLKTDLSVSLNLLIRRTRPITVSDDEGEDEEKEELIKGCKRRRTDPVLPCFLSSNNNIEELDLELRLGVERA